VGVADPVRAGPGRRGILDAAAAAVSDPVTGHAYQAPPPDWGWGDQCMWFDTTPPVSPHPVTCALPERCHAEGTLEPDTVMRAVTMPDGSVWVEELS
jgi:hypothetical protein